MIVHGKRTIITPPQTELEHASAKSCCAIAAVVLAAAIALAGSIQQEDLADAIYGDGVSTGVHTTALRPCFKALFPKQHCQLACMLSCSHIRTSIVGRANGAVSHTISQL